jgi:hypothetical protein
LYPGVYDLIVENVLRSVLHRVCGTNGAFTHKLHPRTDALAYTVVPTSRLHHAAEIMILRIVCEKRAIDERHIVALVPFDTKSSPIPVI